MNSLDFSYNDFDSKVFKIINFEELTEPKLYTQNVKDLKKIKEELNQQFIEISCKFNQENFKWSNRQWKLQDVKTCYDNAVSKIDTLIHEKLNVKNTRAKEHWNMIREVLPAFKGINQEEGVVPIDFENYGPELRKAHLYPEREEFQAWKTSQDIKPFSGKHKVEYFDSKGLLRCVTTFEKPGIFVGGQHAKDAKYKFVLSPDNIFYMAEDLKKRPNGLKLQHSSFLHGKPIKSAGIAKVKNGKIVSIVFHSGHYKPGNKQMLNMIKFLKKSASNFDDILFIKDKKSKSIIVDAGLGKKILDGDAQAIDHVKDLFIQRGDRPIEIQRLDDEDDVLFNFRYNDDEDDDKLIEGIHIYFNDLNR